MNHAQEKVEKVWTRMPREANEHRELAQNVAKLQRKLHRCADDMGNVIVDPSSGQSRAFTSKVCFKFSKVAHP